MNRLTFAFALAASVSAASTIALAQQPTAAEMSTWSTKLDADKLTDKRVLTATATAHADENPAHVYQLTIKCDGEPREFALSAWDTTGAGVGKMNGRAIAWQSRVVTTGGDVVSRDSTTGAARAFSPVQQNDVDVPKSFRYRVDNAPAGSSILQRVTDNTGHLLPTDIFIPPSPSIASGGALSAEQERVLGRIAAISQGDSLTPILPKQRLIVADLFPNETVEFQFNALTADARQALQNMCKFGSQSSPSAASGMGPGAGDAKRAVPRPISTTQARYTPAAMQAQLQGTVQVACAVLRDGTVGACDVVRSSLTSSLALDKNAKKAAQRQASIDAGTHELEMEAVRCVRQWRFQPVPTDTPFTVDVEFERR